MSLDDLPDKWDLVIIGGGITGAGIFREAVSLGLRVLLAERKDFAWGTSSRSSKLVHGGFRYLREGQFLLTKASVEERERLLKEVPGLVDPVGFLLPVYEDHGLGRWTLSLGLWIYDFIALKIRHKFYDACDFTLLAPHIRQEALKGGFYFLDAQVDDARMVLRLINESVASGGFARNYLSISEIGRNGRGDVVGVTVEDTETHQTKTLSTRAVVNATGCWAEKLHPSPEARRRLRPLRGSHLVFPHWALPVAQAVGFPHQADNRTIYAIPWEGAVIVGTTDIDHREDLSIEPVISEEEFWYLMEGLQEHFPSLELTPRTCISTFSGIRPVLSEGHRAPSEETREHVVWVNKGLVTVTGGKLTTFRRLAWDALKAIRPFLVEPKVISREPPVFSPVPGGHGEDFGLSFSEWRRLCGRYGKRASELVENANREDLMLIPGTQTLWAELPFVARNENVRHLTDLLLRRVRIGLLLPEGGKAHLGRIQKLCGAILPWDEARWEAEVKIYSDHLKSFHSLPGRV